MVSKIIQIIVKNSINDIEKCCLIQQIKENTINYFI